MIVTFAECCPYIINNDDARIKSWCLPQNDYNLSLKPHVRQVVIGLSHQCHNYLKTADAVGCKMDFCQLYERLNHGKANILVVSYPMGQHRGLNHQLLVQPRWTLIFGEWLSCIWVHYNCKMLICLKNLCTVVIEISVKRRLDQDYFNGLWFVQETPWRK